MESMCEFWPLTMWSSCHLLIVCSQVTKSFVHLPHPVSVNTGVLHYHATFFLWIDDIHMCFLGIYFKVFKMVPWYKDRCRLCWLYQRGDGQRWVEEGGKAQQIDSESRLFSQISFSAAPVLQTCSCGPFPAMSPDSVTSLSSRVLNGSLYVFAELALFFFGSLYTSWKLGLSRTHFIASLNEEIISKTVFFSKVWPMNLLDL